MDGSSSSSARNRIKNIKFSLGKGNRSDGKLVVVGKHELTDAAGAGSPGTLRIKDKQNAPAFIRDVLLSDDFLSATPPKVIISVTGAAADFPIDPKIEAVFCKGLVNAAKSTTAWIVSGGTDVGVMKLVGEANRLFADDVTTIGFATYNKLNNKNLLKPAEPTIEYDGTAVVAPGSVNLNSNHSHFVLVESPVDAFGEEIEARSDFEEYMCTTYQLPLCLIVVNGGPGTLRTVAEGCNRQFSVVIFEGTGRAADAIAREVRRKRGLPYEHLEPMKLNNEQLAWMNEIVTNSNYITLYSTEKGQFDFVILKSILSSAHGSLLKKLLLAIQWDRRDLAEHVLEEASHEKLSTEEFGGILTKALEYALDQEKPELFRLFAEKGAKKTDLNLSTLYTTEVDKGVYILDPMITRYAPHLPTHRNFRTAHPKTRSVKISDKGPLLDSDGAMQKEPLLLESRTNIDEARFIRAIFENIGFGHYAKLIKVKLKVQAEPKRKNMSHVSSNSEITLSPIDPKKDLNPEAAAELAKVKFTDALLWAILSGKLELAKVIWEYTTLPIHSALIAAGACKGVGNWLLNESEAFNETAEYFEKCATELLESMDYEGATTLFNFDWPEFGKNTLELAVDNECKDFMSNSHVQRYLDGLLYSDDKGTIPPGTSALSVIFNIFFPFLLYPSKTYEVNLDAAESRRSRWYYFYGLPYTKFWTSTLCYIGYLILLVFVLAGAQGGDISPIEILLWVWMAAIALEEVSQCMEEGWAYFKYTSNKMDIFILLLNIVYFSLAIAAFGTGSATVQLASTDILIVTTIISYIRLMDVFSISKELGPLYIVLIKIVGDVFKWVFVFILFAIGFQVSFMALQNQVDVGESSSGSEAPLSMWTPAIAQNPGSFMSAYYIILGDWATPMGALGSGGFAAVVVSIYALISQIMLVNLLIAMMGDTFNNVKENSDKEWRFSRYNLIMEYTSASFHPPPFNIVVVPIKKLVGFCLRCCSDKVPIDNDPDNRQSSRKQRDQFKNLMRDCKDDFLDEQKKKSERTIESVSDTIRDSFKQILDESEMKHKSIELKLTEIVKKTEAINVSAGGAGSSPVQSADIKMEMNFVQENVKTTVQSELAQLKTSLLDAIKSSTPTTTETTTMTLQGKQIPITWNSGTGITHEIVQRIIKEWRPFVLWQENMNKPDAIQNTIVNSITIQAVDMFGPRIGFVKFMANVVSSTGSRVPGIVFMRGGAVGMLTILKLSDEGSPDHNKEYTILTIQPRVPIGQTRFAEIPAGMIDGGRFAGAAAKEMKEETGIDIQEDQLIDLTSLAYKGHHVGMYPSAGGCDEVIRLYLFRTTVNREQLNGYQNKLTGIIDEGEVISLKVVPLQELWLHAPDAKALSALYLYEKLMQTGEIPTVY